MAQPSKITKLLIGAKNVYTHKSLVKFDTVDTENDGNYKVAEERFLAFRAQLLEIIQNADQFRARLKESVGMASKLAHNFSKMSQGEGGDAAMEAQEPWCVLARKHADMLKTSTSDSVAALEDLLFVDMDKYMLSDLKAVYESYNDVNKLVKERYELKVELQHYSDKVQELNENPKVPEERKVRNAEKYATANTRLREQTDALMRRFAEAEVRRRRMLEEDLPRLMDLQRGVFASLAENSDKAAQGITLAPMRAARSSVFSSKDLSGSTSVSGAYSVPGQRPSTSQQMAPGMADVPLGEIHRLSVGDADATKQASFSDFKRSGSSGMEADTTIVSAKALRQSSHSVESTESADSAPPPHASVDQGANGAAQAPEEQDVPATAAATPENVAVIAEPDASTREFSSDAAGGSSSAGMLRVRALYDFDAAQDGDLSFKQGDIILTDAAQWSADGWVTGSCNGLTGQFPSNYTERID